MAISRGGIIIPIVDINTQPNPPAGKILISTDGNGNLATRDSTGTVSTAGTQGPQGPQGPGGGGGGTGTPSYIAYFDGSGNLTGDSNFYRDIASMSQYMVIPLGVTSFTGISIGTSSHIPKGTILTLIEENGSNAFVGAMDLGFLGATGSPGAAMFVGGQNGLVISTSSINFLSNNQFFKFPTSDGSSGDVMSTDGMGNLYFITPGGGGSVTGTPSLVPYFNGSGNLSMDSMFYRNRVLNSTIISNTGSIAGYNWQSGIISGSGSNIPSYLTPPITGSGMIFYNVMTSDFGAMGALDLGIFGASGPGTVMIADFGNSTGNHGLLFISDHKGQFSYIDSSGSVSKIIVGTNSISNVVSVNNGFGIATMSSGFDPSTGGVQQEMTSYAGSQGITGFKTKFGNLHIYQNGIEYQWPTSGNTGDVMTFDGFSSLQFLPPAVQSHISFVSSTDLYNAGTSSTIKLIDAPAGGHSIIPISCVVNYIYGSTAYVSENIMQQPIVYIGFNLDSTPNIVTSINVGGSSNSLQSCIPTTFTASSATSLELGVAWQGLTAGDGNFQFNIIYSIVPF